MEGGVYLDGESEFSLNSMNSNFVPFSESGDNLRLNEPIYYLDNINLSAVFITYWTSTESNFLEFGILLFCLLISHLFMIQK